MRTTTPRGERGEVLNTEKRLGDMKSNTTDTDVERISLLGSLTQEWIKLPVAAMVDVGPAAQTLGGILRMTKRETFASAVTIANRARLPVATVRKHLVALDAGGWIENQGRGKTRAGIPRRTCTVKLTSKSTDAAKGDYGFLPLWACCSLTKIGRLPWSTRAVLSVVMSRLCSLKAAAERDGSSDDDEVEGWIANAGDDQRFAFPLRRLEALTGLTRESLARAKLHLHRLKIVTLTGGQNPETGIHEVDLLVPNYDLRVIVTPAKPGFCRIALGWSDSG